MLALRERPRLTDSSFSRSVETCSTVGTRPLDTPLVPRRRRTSERARDYGARWYCPAGDRAPQRKRDLRLACSLNGGRQSEVSINNIVDGPQAAKQASVCVRVCVSALCNAAARPQDGRRVSPRASPQRPRTAQPPRRGPLYGGRGRPGERGREDSAGQEVSCRPTRTRCRSPRAAASEDRNPRRTAGATTRSDQPTSGLREPTRSTRRGHRRRTYFTTR